ncbi:nitrate reductase molybdenum cofactor assembly chaperone (plasmid) [Paracoccus versutus]|uniref:Respiratory nitrate reductase chaperone NarJ n=1 Tax=Paracoccus versutus TaxID=34007 RepID=A0AAQ0HFF3_PARVE|nr:MULTISPECIES: nitrate reductase molybdenum cofactor assembly chaperone [Paracoccus]SFY29850.1 respiratory nitrate reductase chaperone NarJ [Paracoccus pantotrophus]KGJ09862.1 nitrate reductase [Paracoccus versutus]MBT0782091.1 nitrate reductase molybdenum cofactor assembly chaperone [Paracoccus sp. pheM1]RDD71317.1 nitrate reductase molybdenum cofactor assembly chaperone [Paracoccus versutus]REG38477.1 respiratory nitrate reductase chaperone NarJ [Paracoccus versutus]
MKSFKALSALLSYPSEELIAALPEIDAVLHAEGLLGPKRMEEIARLLQELRQGDLYDLQERYVLLFDRSRSLSLNLFEHVHGESRDRGGAMVDLLETYRAGGFDLVGPELPDHLPVLLEYLSTRPLPEAEALLADAAHILVALADRLTRRESAYAGVLSALVTLVVTEPPELPEELAAVPDDDPEDLAALDAVWEEAQVTFGPDPNAGCPVSRDILARMDAPRVANPAQ